MLIEAARRAEAAAKEILALVNEGSASCAEMRDMLAVSKATVAIMSVAQASAAASIAGRERHGDGGTQVLADTARVVAARCAQPGQDGQGHRRCARGSRCGGRGPSVAGQRQAAG